MLIRLRLEYPGTVADLDKDVDCKLDEVVGQYGKEDEEEDAPMELAGRVNEMDRQGPIIRMPGRVFLRTISPDMNVEARTLLGCKGDDEYDEIDGGPARLATDA